jgi:magnesium-transporting ATPase (P-type)
VPRHFEEDDETPFFVNRYLKYMVIDDTVSVSSFEFEEKFSELASQISPLEEQQVLRSRNKFGIGTMVISKPSVFTLLLTEVLKPLYIFTLLALVIWIPNKYYFYATMLVIVGIVGIIVNLYQINDMNKKICELAFYETSVMVLRAEGAIELSSRDVVPGDIVFFKESIKVPFDVVILEGSCLVN